MTTDNRMEKPTTPAKSSLAEKISLVIGMISVVGIFFTLMGVGVALSAEILFGIPHATLFGSYFELLQLGSWAVPNIFSGVSELLKHPIKYLEVASMHGSASFIATIVVCLGAIATIAKYLGRTRMRAGGRSRFMAWIFRKPTISHDSYAALWVRAGLFGVTVWVFNFFVAPFIAAGLVLMFCFFVALVPVLSIAAGEAHIRTYVVGPESCFPVRNRDTVINYWDQKQEKSTNSVEKPKPVAMCVSIMDGELALFSGRVVWVTSQSILLFDPATGEVKRMSLNNRDVKVVDELTAPSAQTSVPMQTSNSSLSQPTATDQLNKK